VWGDVEDAEPSWLLQLGEAVSATRDGSDTSSIGHRLVGDQTRRLGAIGPASRRCHALTAGPPRARAAPSRYRASGVPSRTRCSQTARTSSRTPLRGTNSSRPQGSLDVVAARVRGFTRRTGPGRTHSGADGRLLSQTASGPGDGVGRPARTSPGLGWGSSELQ